MTPTLPDKELLAIFYKQINIALRGLKHVHRIYPEELLGAAWTGWNSAAQRFDPTTGAKLTTFCWHRMRGAISDEIRNRHGGRYPGKQEFYRGLVSLDRFDIASFVQLDHHQEMIENRESAEMILSCLKPKVRAIVRAHYFDGITQAEIGHWFSLSESRISQIIRHAKDAMKQEGEEKGL